MWRGKSTCNAVRANGPGVIEDEETASGHLHDHEIATEKLVLAF